MFCLYIVEDRQDLAWVLRESFAYAGYSVVTASNGLEALQRMRRRPPDLVVLDVNMPVMDGFTVARRMREDPLLAEVPIVFLTVLSDFASKATGYRAGADDYVVKPFDMPELRARVQAVLRRSAPKEADERDKVRCATSVLDLPTGIIEVDGRSVQLTEVECDIARYLMSHPGEPISAQQLLRDVLDYPSGTGDTSAVRWHIKNLRHKIEPDPEHPAHLFTVAARGYSFQ